MEKGKRKKEEEEGKWKMENGKMESVIKYGAMRDKGKTGIYWQLDTK